MIDRNTNIRDIHIGKIIKQKFITSNLTYNEFAEQLHCDRSNIYRLFKRKSVDCEMLVRISQILCYNFLLEYQSIINGNEDHKHSFEVEISENNLLIDNISGINIKINNASKK